MNSETLSKIKTGLKENGIDFSDVADRIGVTRQCVSQHLNGKLKKVNPMIIETALLMLSEQKAFEKNISKKVNALIDN
jgi:predicted DNA-binding protein (UPF0251 family)